MEIDIERMRKDKVYFAEIVFPEIKLSDHQKKILKTEYKSVIFNHMKDSGQTTLNGISYRHCMMFDGDLLTPTLDDIIELKNKKIVGFKKGE